MSLIQRMKSIIENVATTSRTAIVAGVDKSKTAAQAVKDERRRKALVVELGELVHSASVSGTDIGDEQDRLIAAIDEIDAAAEESELDGEPADTSDADS